MPADTRAPVEILLVEDLDDDANWTTQALTQGGGVGVGTFFAKEGEGFLTVFDPAQVAADPFLPRGNSELWAPECILSPMACTSS